MRRRRLIVLSLSIAVFVFAYAVGCDSNPPTAGSDSAENSTPNDATVSPTSDNSPSNNEAPAPASQTQNAKTVEAAPKSSESTSKPTTVATILFNECSAPESLEGWHVVNDLGCQCAWPVDKEFSDFALYLGRGEEPVFSFGVGPRDEEFTIDQILTATKKATTTGMRVTESKELNVGDGIRCLAYAGENRSDRQLFRIYITESLVWVISAGYPKANDLHPSLNYFFKNFKVISDVSE